MSSCGRRRCRGASTSSRGPSRRWPSAWWAWCFLLIVAVLAGVHLPPQTWVDMAVRLMLGSIPFIALGFALAYLCRSERCAAVANLLFIVLAFGSGMLIRVDQMPDFLAAISPYLPTYHYAQLAWGSIGASSEDVARFDRLVRRLRPRVLRRRPPGPTAAKPPASSGSSRIRRQLLPTDVLGGSPWPDRIAVARFRTGPFAPQSQPRRPCPASLPRVTVRRCTSRPKADRVELGRGRPWSA